MGTPPKTSILIGLEPLFFHHPFWGVLAHPYFWVDTHMFKELHGEIKPLIHGLKFFTTKF